ncbi:MAG: hypothetical protein LBK95_18455 [Bifidobacteriaceae bacterium]|nr:hypothetical protein [Bifidobacteriaceae bacterium]
MRQAIGRVSSSDLTDSTKRVMDAVIHDGKTLEVTYHGVTKARITPIADAVTATGNPVEQAVRSGRAASAVPASPAEE